MTCPSDPREWTRVHQPKPPEEEADELADVFNAVSEREQERIRSINRNLKGKYIMTEAFNTQLSNELDDKIVHTRNNYGDPMSILGKHLPQASRDYYARMTNSLHWYMQNSVIVSARVMLFDLYKELKEESIRPDESYADNFNNFCADIHDTLKHDDLWENNQACINAAEKYRLMLNWGDIAQAAAMANDRDFAPKSLPELLLQEKPAKVRTEVRMNYEMIAERAARKYSNDPVKIKERKEERMRQFLALDENRAADRVKDNKKIISSVEVVIEHIEQHVPKRVIFTSMDKKFMRQAIEYTKRTLTRISEQEIAQIRNLSVQEFSRILDAQDNALDELEQFYKDHATDAEELESNNYSGDPVEAHNRRQKKIAASEIGSATIDAEALKRKLKAEAEVNTQG